MVMQATMDKPIVICVFCGASSPKNPVYLQAARDLAKAMHEVGAKLVYGAGTIGMMGEVARTLVQLSGPEAVHGVIPEALVKHEQGKKVSTNGGARLTNKPDEALYGRTTVVKDMHTRKALMAKEVIAGGPGSGFVALPGGYGTMEELMEITTWNQLGIHKMPVCLLNTNGFYDGLISWVRLAVDDGFIAQANKDIITEAREPTAVVKALLEYKIAEGRFDLDWDATSAQEEKSDPFNKTATTAATTTMTTSS